MTTPAIPHMRAPGSYRTRLREGISRYTPGDAQALCEFRAAMYGRASVFSDVAYLRWMFEECPNAEAPSLWLFRKDGEIFAQQGAIPAPLLVSGREHRAAWALDLMVHPTYRLRGVGPVLVDVCREQQPITMGIEVSDEAARALRRDGWTELGTLPLYMRPLSLAQLLDTRFKRRFGRTLGRLADKPLALGDRTLAAAARLRGVAMRRVDGFDPDLDGLWARASAHYDVIARRDAATLNWRFARGPRRERYELFTFVQGRGLRGYAVLRVGEAHGLPSGHIVDFLAEPAWLPWIFMQCLRYLRGKGAAAAYCASSWGGADALLRSLGFFKRDTGFRIMFRAADDVARETTALHALGNWFITAGDANVDRPREGLQFA